MSAPATLPADVDAEKAILGAVLLDNAAHAEAAETVKSDDFSLDSHRRIFLRMGELADSGRAADIVTLSDELRRHKEIESIGGVAYLASLTEGLPRRPVIADYIGIVKEKSRLRRTLKLAELVTARVYGRAETGAQTSAWAAQEFTALADEDDADGMRLLRGAEISSEPVPWILENHIPDRTVFGIHGRPGDGKTTCSIRIGADLSRGRTPYTGTPCAPRNFLVLSNEDSPGRIRNLFESMGGDLDRLSVENTDDCWTLGDLARLERAIVKSKSGLVIIDSLASHSGKTDLNSHAETTRILVPIRGLAERLECSVAVIHHLNKMLTTDHILKVSGSIGITSSFRHNLHVIPDPENPELRLLINGKTNLARYGAPALKFSLFPCEWGGELALTIEEAYQNAGGEDDRPGEAVKWLKETLSDYEWHDAGNLLRQAESGFNLARRSIFRAADRLKVERRKEGFGGKASWRLPMSATINATPSPLGTHGTHGTHGEPFGTHAGTHGTNGLLKDLENENSPCVPCVPTNETGGVSGTHGVETVIRETEPESAQSAPRLPLASKAQPTTKPKRPTAKRKTLTAAKDDPLAAAKARAAEKLRRVEL